MYNRKRGIIMRVLLCDDDHCLRLVQKELLLAEQHEIFESSNGSDALAMAQKVLPDLIVLDVIIPVIDGFKVCKIIRRKPKLYGNPIIMMLTSKNDIEDIKKGFIGGADEYIKKPFDNSEFVLRVQALSRRRNTNTVKLHKYKNIIIDVENPSVSIDGKEIRVTKKEYELLSYLVINKGLVLNRDKIMSEVWDKPYLPEDKSIDNVIRHLKDKVEGFEESLETIKGFGYRLKD